MHDQTTDHAPLAPPVRAGLPADLETPVSVFLKLKSLGAAFLFESVERGIQMGRYSFIGLAPRVVISLADGVVTTERRGGAGTRVTSAPVDADDPFAPVRAELAREAGSDGGGPLPPAYGGAVGFIGYDMVRYFERVPLPVRPDEADLPDYRFMFPATIAVFDHVRNEIEFLTTPPDGQQRRPPRRPGRAGPAAGRPAHAAAGGRPPAPGRRATGRSSRG